MPRKSLVLKEPVLDPERSYVESNSFITAVYDKRLTALGQKLIRIAVAEADSKHDNEFYTYRIRMSDLADLLQMTETEKVHIYRDVKKACKYMATMAIGFEEASTKKNKSPDFNYLPLFRSLRYHNKEGWLEIQFNDAMTPFFLQLKGKFTEIPLWQILQMDHKYSIRIYELIKMKLFNSKRIEDGTYTNSQGKEFPLDHKTIELSLDEIRRTIGDNKYKQIGQLKDFVLNPAFKDISKSAHYHCEYRDIKEGRKVIGFMVDVWRDTAWSIMQMDKDQIKGQGNIFTWMEQNT